MGRRVRSVCCWGTFERDYPRNRTLIAALERAGFEVTTVNHSVWERDQDKPGAYAGLTSKLKLGLRLAGAYALLSWRLLRVGRCDLMLVMYPGHFDMPLARVLSRLKRSRLVFDVFISLYDYAVTDRGLYRDGSRPARLLRWIDRRACRLADEVLIDTQAHLRFFVEKLGVSPERIHVVPVGADEPYFGTDRSEEDDTDDDPRLVLFWGKYAPLHGVEVIVRCAARLRRRGDVRFLMVGEGQTKPLATRLAEESGLTNVEFIGSVPPEELAILTRRATVCLGIFGTTPKAGRVIPNKVYSALAAGRAVVTADSPAMNRGLVADREVVLVPPGRDDLLAEAVTRLIDDRERRRAIASAGRRAYFARFSTGVIAEQLRQIIDTPRDRPGPPEDR